MKWQPFNNWIAYRDEHGAFWVRSWFGIYLRHQEQPK